MPYIFINPDDTQERTLHVLVHFPTGVEYANQCGGYLTEERTAEGFLIPLGGPEAARPLIDWFWKTFRGHSYRPVAEWTETRIAELKVLVSSIACWWTVRDGMQDEPRFLELDEARMMECTEGWVPVKTPYGPGILLFENSD